MSLARFNREFDKAMSVAVKGSEKAIQQGVDKLFTKIIMDTPVATGQLRGNWQTSIDAPTTAQLPGTLDKDGFSTAMKSKAIIRRFKFEGSSERTIFMSNNLDYANQIEFGQYSNQAPYGMVRVNVTQFKSEIDKAANKFRR